MNDHRIIARVPKEIYQKIEKLAKQQQRTKSNMIRVLLKKALRKQRPEFDIDEYKLLD